MNVRRKNSSRILRDADTPPEITDEWVAGADLYHGNTVVRRGRPLLPNPRQLLSLRLPPDVVARWRSSGPGWQTRMAKVLEKSAPKSSSASA